MMIKWVSCRVLAAGSFDHGQRAWSGLSGRSGFLGQHGGWSSREPDVAQIFSGWAGRRDYEGFMAEAHDQLAAGQGGTYDTIEVRLFDHHLDIGPGWPSGCSAGSVLRLAYCQVKPGRQDHFARVQVEVWNPGMRAAPGMCGGVFARRGQTEFLVLSLWNSVADHERYRVDRFPDLYHRAGASDDIDGIIADVVELDPAWTVTGQPPT